MAFTDAQKAKIRFYLGYQERFIRYYSLLEAQMAAGTLSTDAEAIVIGILAELASLDTELTKARKRIKAQKVGSIELQPKEISMLLGEGRRHVGRLASMFGVEVMSDVYAEGGPGASGGLIPLG